MAQFAAEFPEWEGLTVSMPRRPACAAAAAIAVALAASGCSHGARATDDPSASPTTASPTPSRAPDKLAIAKQEIIAAYRATFADVNVAVIHRNRNDSALNRHAIGGGRIQLVQSVDFYLKADVVPRGLPQTRIAFKSLSLYGDPPLATITACVDSSRVPLVDARSGKLAKGFVSKPGLDKVIFRVSRGRWMVEAFKFGTTRC
jgi:hypothetical protein